MSKSFIQQRGALTQDGRRGGRKVAGRDGDLSDANREIGKKPEGSDPGAFQEMICRKPDREGGLRSPRSF